MMPMSKVLTLATVARPLVRAVDSKSTPKEVPQYWSMVLVRYRKVTYITKVSRQALACCFFASETGSPIANNSGICLNTVLAPI